MLSYLLPLIICQTRQTYRKGSHFSDFLLTLLQQMKQTIDPNILVRMGEPDRRWWLFGGKINHSLVRIRHFLRNVIDLDLSTSHWAFFDIEIDKPFIFIGKHYVNLVVWTSPLIVAGSIDFYIWRKSSQVRVVAEDSCYDVPGGFNKVEEAMSDFVGVVGGKKFDLRLEEKPWDRARSWLACKSYWSLGVSRLSYYTEIFKVGKTAAGFRLSAGHFDGYRVFLNIDCCFFVLQNKHQGFLLVYMLQLIADGFCFLAGEVVRLDDSLVGLRRPNRVSQRQSTEKEEDQ